MRPHGDRGQVVPLVACSLLVLAVIAVGLVEVADVLVDRATARTAADAAALELAATGDAHAAAAIARENGADLVDVARRGDEVEVTVQVGRVTARARASGVREWRPPAGRTRVEGTIP